ncbi:MAG: ATP synthase F1 subunit delta [Lachnospiraceae bacterium]|nr:ATP synthase F1 subunit delta [Lachnospiraceae bacterium]
MAKLVSKTYGDALFELALEKEDIPQMKEEVLSVKQIFEENEELLKLLNHPKIMGEEKIQIIEKIFKGKVSDDMTGFLTIIVGKGRYNEILDIFTYIERRIKEYEKIGVAKVSTPMKLTKKQKDAIVKRLLEITEYESFEVEYTIDESLIGGMVIRIDDRVVDSSIKTKLANMAKALNQIQLN